MITVETYSPKGIVLRGASAEQAEGVRASLGAAVVTTFNPSLGGWCFSRKREDRIRAVVAELNGGAAPCPPDDDLPGKWWPLTDSEPDPVSA